MSAFETDIIVIGAGPVGLFTVFQAGMLGMKCHVVDALPAIGGQCSALYPEKPIYDIPSRPVVTGEGLIAELQAQALPFDPVYHLGQQVVSLKKTGDEWSVMTAAGAKITASVVIIAAGAGAFVPNRPPLDGIEDFEGKSVFYVVNDKSRFTGKDIVIAGGGDSAVDWAVSLFDVAKSVSVIHRRDKFRAMPETVAQMHRLAENYPDRFKLYTPYQLSGLQGADGVLQIVNVETMEGEKESITADYLIPLYGLKAELGPIADWGLNIDSHTISVTPSSCETSCKGVYAIGDVAGYEAKLKLILTGFAEAATACHHAYQYVFPGKALHFEYSTSKGVA